MPSRTVIAYVSRVRDEATGTSSGMRGRSRWKGVKGDLACERIAAEVTVALRGRRTSGAATVHSSASEPKPLCMKSRRDHASAGGRKLIASPSASS